VTPPLPNPLPRGEREQVGYPPRGLFITGTNTEVGKTYVAAMIIRWLAAAGRRVAAYKPVASGCESVDGRLVSEDALQLWEASGKHGALEEVCPQQFAAAVAPHRAAAAENRKVDSDLLRSGLAAWNGRCEIVIVEGAGGLMSPVSDDDYAADLAVEFGYPLIVVSANRLGVINETLQTLITAVTYHENMHVAGVVLNDALPDLSDASRRSNYEELISRCGPPVLDHVAYGADRFSSEIDWWPLSETR